MSKYLLLSIFFAFLCVNRAEAQNRCATEERYQNLPSHIKQPKAVFEAWLKKKLSQKAENLRSFKAYDEQEEYLVPVVVHIIHNGEAEGEGANIPDAQIHSQIEVLNKDFNRENADTINTPENFQGVAADVGIRFVLARTDPYGFFTNGIVRVQAAKDTWSYSADEKELKSLSYWPADDYINIWVVNRLSANFIGFSTYPVSDLEGIIDPNFNPLVDGIVLSREYFGSIEHGDFELDEDYNRGRSLTHEMGHYFGLRHIWGDINNCSADDYCDDTPMVDKSHSSCPETSFSCGSENMFQNFMDYTPDRCMNLFTECQKSRMRTVVENSPRRTSLLTSPGLTPPPGFDYDLSLNQIVNPTVVSCENIFIPEIKLVNVGLETIHNFTVGYQVDEGSLETLEFTNTGFEPGEIVNVEFNPLTLQNGEYEFKAFILDVNGAEDSNPSNNSRSTRILVDDAADFVPLAERFHRVFDWERIPWTTINFSNDLSWTLSRADNGEKNNISAVIRAFESSNVGEEDWLISPTLDFTFTDSVASMRFDLSYAHRANRNDRLRIVASTDCGKTFPHLLYNKSAANLSVRQSSESWSPAGPADWKKEVVDLSVLAGQPEARLAFVFLNGNGNNLYIDNIEFFNYDASILPNDSGNEFFIYPNPADNFVQVILNLWERQEVEIILADAYGRQIRLWELPNALNQSFDLDLPPLQTGLYVIWVRGKNFSKGKKLMIAR